MDQNENPMHEYPGDTSELDELLGAYALDALDADERRRVEDYLSVNPRAAAEVQDHREIATMLAFTGSAAPDHVWDRIADEITEPAPAPGPQLAKLLSIDDRPARRRISTVAPWIMTAAAAAVIAFVAIAIADRAVAPDEPLAAAVEIARADRDSITTVLVAEGVDATAEAIIDQDGHGYILANDLPPLERGLTYQLWGVIGDQVISLGIFGPTPEIETFTVESEVSALAITVEQWPGVVSDGNPDGAFVGTF
jgi:anti-sigma-K factor RskA